MITSLAMYREEPDPWQPLAELIRKYEGITDPEDPVSIITWLNENGRLYHVEYKRSERTIQDYTGEIHNQTILKYFACVDSEEDAALLKLFTGAVSEEEEIAWLLSS